MSKDLRIVSKAIIRGDVTADTYSGSGYISSNVYPGDETILTATSKTAVLSSENNDLPDGPVGKYIEKVIVSNLNTQLPGSGGVSPLVNGQVLTDDNDFVLNVTIYDTKKIGNNLYIAGKFTKLRTGTGIGGTDILTGLQNLIGYDTVTNTYFDPVGLNISFNVIKSLEVSGTKLYIGGRGTVANESLFVYDTNAQTTALIPELSHYVDKLFINIIFNPNLLFVGGSFNEIDGTLMNSSGFCNYDINNGIFTDISGGLPLGFYGYSISGNDNYPVLVSGRSNSGIDVFVWNGNNIAQFNVGLQPSDIVYALEAVISGPAFYFGGTISGGIQLYNNGVVTNLGSGLSLTNSNPIVYTIENLSGLLYVGGIFDDAGGTIANNIAIWNGSSWDQFVYESIFFPLVAQQGVTMLKEIDGELYMAKTNDDSVYVYQQGGVAVTVNVSSDVLYENGTLTNPVTIEYDKKKVFTWAADRWIV